MVRWDEYPHRLAELLPNSTNANCRCRHDAHGGGLGVLLLGQIAALRADNDSSKHLQPYNPVNLPP